MNEIKIIWISDSNDCDTCGGGYAEGARVYHNNELIVELEPMAHCFDGTSYSPDEVYKEILKHFGFELTVGYQ